MEDVIFSGTSNKPSKNISEVTLMLDNSSKENFSQFKDFDEISVRRKIEREKGSKYFINDKEVRARDVQTLFADLSTGAHSPSLISYQGKLVISLQTNQLKERLYLKKLQGFLAFTREDMRLRQGLMQQKII